MAKKLSSNDEKIIKAQLGRFEKLAPDKKFTLGELSKDGRYIHIYRGPDKIGCFKRDRDDKDDLVFVFHDSHPIATRVIDKLPHGDKRLELTDDDIKSAIYDTP